MIQLSKNPEYLKNNIGKDFLGEKNAGSGKDKSIARNTFRSLFYQCKSRVSIFTLLCDVSCWLFLWFVFGIDIPGQLWHGLLRNNAFLRRHRGEALRPQVVLEISMITSTPKSLLESFLCRSTCMIGVSHASLPLYYCKIWQWLHFFYS